jgi:hypothetical protein
VFKSVEVKGPEKEPSSKGAEQKRKKEQGQRKI